MSDSGKQKLKRSHEDSMSDVFKSRLGKVARQNGKVHLPFPLDGQDRDLAADLLVAGSTRFCLVEFKSSKNKIKTEKNKDLSLMLCKALPKSLINSNVHRKSHFIGWANGNPPQGTILNVYEYEVCNNFVWENEFFVNDIPNDNEAINDIDFSEKFFNQTLGANDQEFIAYISWLLDGGSNDPGGDTSQIELIIENPSDNVFDTLTFFSLSALKKWLDDNYSESKPNLIAA